MNLVSKAGYYLEEQVEIAGTDTIPVSPKVERVDGVLNQGQAGYYLEEQMEISAVLWALPLAVIKLRAFGSPGRLKVAYPMPNSMIPKPRRVAVL